MCQEAGSVTEILRSLENGGEEAAQEELYQRYYHQVLNHARRWTSDFTVADEEDVAVSVWNSFFQGVARGKFPQCTDRTAFEKLMAKITFRKAVNLRRWLRAGKRSLHDKTSNEKIVRDGNLDDLDEPHRVVAELYFVEKLDETVIARQLAVPSAEITRRLQHVRSWLRRSKYRGGELLHGDAVDAARVQEPGPLDQLIAAELLTSLPLKFRQTVELLLQGNDVTEVANYLNVCEETVKRRLRFVRRIWEGELVSSQ